MQAAAVGCCMGAGLGLSITRSIIHAHGGELSAEQQGREIVFKVRLLMD